MATKKQAIPQDQKLEKQDFNLFEAIDALDRKDYGYWDTLTNDQQRKFVPYLLLQWMSSVRGDSAIQSYYLMNTDVSANKYMFNEAVYRNPKLQWLTLCAISPGIGKQRHEWIPQISKKVVALEEKAKLKDVKEYYAKIYPTASPEDIEEVSRAYVNHQHTKVYLAEHNPTLKLEDIDALSSIITKEDIEQYEKDIGN